MECISGCLCVRMRVKRNGGEGGEVSVGEEADRGQKDCEYLRIWKTLKVDEKCNKNNSDREWVSLE